MQTVKGGTSNTKAKLKESEIPFYTLRYTTVSQSVEKLS